MPQFKPILLTLLLFSLQRAESHAWKRLTHAKERGRRRTLCEIEGISEEFIGYSEPSLCDGQDSTYRAISRSSDCRNKGD